VSQQINLFNPIFLKKTKLFSAATMAQTFALIGVVLIALGFLYASRLVHVRKDADEAAARLKAAQLQLTQMVERTKPKPMDKSTEDAIRLVEDRLRATRQVLDFVNKGDLGNTQGFTEFFRAFSRTATPGIWLTGFSLLDGGSGMEVRGRALQPTMVPAYLAGLRREAVFKGKSFGSLELRTPQIQSAAKGAVPAKPVVEMPYVEFTLKSTDAIEEHGAQGGGQNEMRGQ
jgi:hypothetical protein